MKYQLGISPAAAADIDDAALYIAARNLSAGLRFYDAVDVTVREIAQHPRRWPLFETNVTQLQDLRRRSVKGFPNYLVFYRYDERLVLIVRVIHGARDLPKILRGET